jgi:uncharacterized cupin superfamily protein
MMPTPVRNRETTMTAKAEKLRSQLIRNFDSIEKTREQRAPLYDTLCARLGAGTAATKLGLSIDLVAPGKRSCPYHFHYAQEEAFVILEGAGHLRVAGEMLALSAGDVVFIPPGPQYPHQIVNTSAAPLKYLSISTRDSPEVVEYPDSGKYLARAEGTLADGSSHVLDRMHRAADDLDYWDGEA